MLLWTVPVTWAGMPDAAQDAQPLERGAYLFKIGGCGSCHSDPDRPEAPLAGGLKLETPFGDFYVPNITPDVSTGIGNWTRDQFIRAVKEGVSPQGGHYYPAFPYTSYTRMSDQELIDLKAYLDSQPAIRQENRAHDLGFPFNQRWLLSVWKGLFFEAGDFVPRPGQSKTWNRGAYLATGPGHCVECHTPRNRLGALERDQLLTGNPLGPDGEVVPGIHGTKTPQFADWEPLDIQFALETGVTPEGDVVGGAMAHVVDNSSSHLNADDLEALAEYLADPG
jgi:mono/diheme cytochrome c family protein